jgi:protein-tyrosine-phosphatase
MYSETGQAVHPAVSEPESMRQPQTKILSAEQARVLFLCTHNSARSQMAEGLLRELGHNKVEAFSAGTEPAGIHPLAIKVMSIRGIDLNTHRSKHLEEYLGQHFDYVITVCDRVREVCPIFPGEPEHIHWSFPDPAAIEGNLKTQEKVFENTARELTIRIQYLLLIIDQSRKETR